jgi:hypothetical protein
MNTATKVGIAGGLGVIGYLVWQHMSASNQIAAVVSTTAPPSNVALPSEVADPNTLVPFSSVPLPPPITPIQIAQPVSGAQMLALTGWANGTPNPTLANQFVQQLAATDANQLYNIIINDWDTGAGPTAAMTSFWNDLVSRYPFLRVGGQGCNNFQCN